MSQFRPSRHRVTGVPRTPFRPENRVLRFQEGTPLPWTVDAASGQAFPATDDEWTQFIAANDLGISNPSHVHNCQDPSGSLSDSVGTDSLAPSTTHLYQQDVTGYSRKGIQFQSNGYANSTLYNPASTSQFSLMIMAHTTPVNRFFYQYGPNASLGLRLWFSEYNYQLIADGADDIYSNQLADTAMRPYFAQYDRSHGATFAGDDRHFLRGTAALTASGANTTFGSVPSGAGTNPLVIYIARWVGPAAEAMTAERVRLLLDAMGFTTSWYSTDVTSGVILPASSVEWHSFVKAKELAVSVPDWLHLMQEPPGSLTFADSIGTQTYSATTTILCQQPIPGYSRKAAGYNGTHTLDATDRWRIGFSNGGPGPDTATTSVAQFGLFHVVGELSGSSAFGVLNFGLNSAAVGLSQLPTNKLRYRQSNNIVDTANVYVSGSVFVAGLVHDITNSASAAYTDLEKLSPAYGPISGTGIAVGDLGSAWSHVRCAYEFGYSGSKAELCTDQNVKALLEAMGWTIPWS